LTKKTKRDFSFFSGAIPVCYIPLLKNYGKALFFKIEMLLIRAKKQKTSSQDWFCFSIRLRFQFFLLAAGNNTLFNIRRYPGEFGCKQNSGSPTWC
jgi:hypothetical protein